MIARLSELLAGIVAVDPSRDIFVSGLSLDSRSISSGDAFVALHGSWHSSVPTGYKVVRVHFANGKPAGGYDDFVTGFAKAGTSPAQVWGRPAGLAVTGDGSLLIADDVGKTVWRVTYTGK